MPIVQKGVAAFSERMPKIISPRSHAIADYAAIGGFLVMAGLLWKRNKKAAMASLICAGSDALNTLMTDFPGGVAKVISFPTHSKIDMGLATTASALPSFMGFSDEPEAKYFRAIGLGMTLVGALTDFDQSRTSRARRVRLHRSA